MANVVTITTYSSATYTLGLYFFPNGGDTAPDPVYKATSTNAASTSLTATIPIQVPTRQYYRFLGYALSADGPVQLQPGGSITHSFTRTASYSGTNTYYVADYNGQGPTWVTEERYTSQNKSSAYDLYAKWEVQIYPPVITEQPSPITAIVGDAAQLSCTATAEGGTLSYQWQSSANGSTWADISGATSSQYSAPTASVGVTYYRVVVTNTLSDESASTISESVAVTVQDLTKPTFTKQPQNNNYAIGTTATPLTVTATSNAPISYSWSRSTNRTSWTVISGATTNSYTPPTSSNGTVYYRATATVSGGSQTKTTDSNYAKIVVFSASTPVFQYDLSSVNETYYATDYITPLDGTATATGTITYQWQRSTDSGSTWHDISGATNPIYTPSSRYAGESRYKVVATSTAGTSVATATSGVAIITILNIVLTPDTKWTQYLSALKKPFVKLARLDFLNPNGSVAFSLDNNIANKRNKAFIQSGDLSVNMQNGQRRTASVTLSNLDGEYDYSVNKLWFGQQVRLWEGMILQDGEEFYISQGVFYVKDPEESFEPGLRQTTLNLVDKWAYLDGTLFGNLDGTYEVPVNSNIFNAIQSVLNLDRGNGQKVDATPPVFTGYYNGKTTTLPDGTTVPLTNTPYTYRCDSENGTYADIILELNTMLAGWIGYDSFGQLRLSPSQDDILDQTKPIQWEFTPLNSTFLGATYSVKNSEVYNDIIIIGESLSEYGQTAGRATNYDPMSDTNANIIGLKTKRYQQSGYYTQDICESLAVFKLKRESVLKKSVSIKCSQMFHLQENNLVTIQRMDKPGAPVERHLITGFSRPIAQTGSQVINAVSVQDFPVATITSAP